MAKDVTNINLKSDWLILNKFKQPVKQGLLTHFRDNTLGYTNHMHTDTQLRDTFIRTHNLAMKDVSKGRQNYIFFINKQKKLIKFT